MSVNFYNEAGALIIGVDLHKYIIDARGVPVPFPLYPHLVSFSFHWPAFFTPKKVMTVTTDAHHALQGGMDYYLVLHAPFPILPAHALETGVIMMVIASAGSKAWMVVHKVTVGGDKAATCLKSCASTNQDCCDPIDMHTNNLVLNFNSVKTEATLGDYLGSYLGTCLDAVINFGLGNELDKKTDNNVYKALLKHVWRRLPDINKAIPKVDNEVKDLKGESDDSVIDWAVDAPGKVSEMIQKWVDGES